MNTRFRILLLPLALLVLLASGCASLRTNDKAVAASYMSETLVVVNPNLENVIVAERIDDFTWDQQLLQLNLLNTSNRPVQITYRVDWFDAAGFVVESTEPVRERINPKDYVFLQERTANSEIIHARVVVY